MDITVGCNQCNAILGNFQGDSFGATKLSLFMPCKHCGGSEPKLHVLFSEQRAMYDFAKGKAKAEGFKRPVVEFKAGTELHRDTNTLRGVSRVIDRQSDSYREAITDAERKIVRKIDESLSVHQGRGAAKLKKKPNE